VPLALPDGVGRPDQVRKAGFFLPELAVPLHAAPCSPD
jgi:hypothetical protein